MITSIPAALPAIAIASSGSPPRNPPTLASIDECVPVSVRVTTLAWGNPAGLAPGVDRPAERGPVDRRVRHVEREPVHRGHPHPRQNAPARPSGATGPASLRNTASITPAPSRCRARVKEDLFGIASSIPSSAPTRFSATSS